MAPLVGVLTPQARSAPAVAVSAVLRMYLPPETRMASRRPTACCRWLWCFCDGGQFCFADLLHIVIVQASFSVEAEYASTAVRAYQALVLFVQALCNWAPTRNDYTSRIPQIRVAMSGHLAAGR